MCEGTSHKTKHTEPIQFLIMAWCERLSLIRFPLLEHVGDHVNLQTICYGRSLVLCGVALIVQCSIGRSFPNLLLYAAVCVGPDLLQHLAGQPCTAIASPENFR